MDQINDRKYQIPINRSITQDLVLVRDSSYDSIYVEYAFLSYLSLVTEINIIIYFIMLATLRSRFCSFHTRPLPPSVD